MLTYLPRDLVKQVDKKLIISNISSNIVDSWNNRNDEVRDLSTQVRDATDDEKERCLAELNEYFSTLRRIARELVDTRIAKAMKDLDITRMDGQAYCNWTDIRHRMNKFEKTDRGIGKQIMYTDFGSSWWYPIEEQLCVQIGLKYRVKESTNRRRGFCAKALNMALNERRKCFTWIPKKIVKEKKGKKKSITFFQYLSF